MYMALYLLTNWSLAKIYQKWQIHRIQDWCSPGSSGFHKLDVGSDNVLVTEVRKCSRGLLSHDPLFEKVDTIKKKTFLHAVLTQLEKIPSVSWYLILKSRSNQERLQMRRLKMSGFNGIKKKWDVGTEWCSPAVGPRCGLETGERNKWYRIFRRFVPTGRKGIP